MRSVSARWQETRLLDMERRHAHVTGVVQGVGFRPFVYTLAKRLALTGWVLNNSQGVDIEVEGPAADLDRFLAALRGEAPPLAHIESVAVTLVAPQGDAEFTIRESQSLPGATLVSPDVCICDDCLRELFDPNDRRYLYPFINCTNCGPRFTIIQDVPYDRPMTTMRVFPMCDDCRREYRDPTNRRFHAQPNACWKCGPNVRFQILNFKSQNSNEGREAIEDARQWLANGKIVAVKGIGGFHLACDATADEAVAELRRRKGRVDKPFALMMPDAETVGQFCELNEHEQSLLTSRQRPIVLLRARPNTAISSLVAPGQNTLGVMLPYSPLHYLLLTTDRRPQTAIPNTRYLPALVMTSGNYSEEPIATLNDEALERLATLADAFLLHNRDIHARCDDSVTQVFSGAELPLRRSRGYAPYPVKLAMELRPTLACGGELKNTFCLANGRHAFLSPHIGDLENYETLASYEAMIEHLKRLFRVEPEIIAYDLHPNYLSTQYALKVASRKSQGTSVIFDLRPVQHHHAHIAACMAENGVSGPVIGAALDGTGYGADGRIWGGEFLVADFADFTRAFHLEYLPLPGSEAAIRKPWRIAVGYAEVLGLDIAGLPFLKNVNDEELRICRQQASKGLNAPLTSSMGRLFDCVAALANVRGEVTYEGQAAMELEQLSIVNSQLSIGQGYLFGLRDGEITVKSLLAEVIDDVRRGVAAGEIGAKFHHTIAEMILVVCQRISEQTGLREVALSGGVFQNVTLLGLTVPLLRDAGLMVYTHSLVPPNDGGIALGQAVVANAKYQISDVKSQSTVRGV
jgi:hydrogenase maturation protein HypF